MLQIKSKYKIAKRLGAGIFEQTQTQKFALSEARKKKDKRGGRGGSDYGKQLLEKQRIRYTYGISERQLTNYAEEAMDSADASGTLHKTLELRADNVVYRAGISPTRRAARQLVSHGHVLVNGRRTTIPSQRLKEGDVVSVREGSRGSILFASFADANSERRNPPTWLSFDPSLLKAEVKAAPEYRREESGLDYATLFEFYSR